MNTDTDSELVLRIRAGNISAYEEVIRRYQRPLLSYVTRMTGNRHDAEEIVQDTFFAVYRGMDRLDPSRKFSSYLFTSAYHTAVSFLRVRKKAVPINELDITEDDLFLYERLFAEDRHREIMDMLSVLDTKHRKAIELYYFEDMSYEEIAGSMHIPLNTVRTYVFRGKERLRKMYENQTI